MENPKIKNNTLGHDCPPILGEFSEKYRGWTRVRRKTCRRKAQAEAYAARPSPAATGRPAGGTYPNPRPSNAGKGAVRGADVRLRCVPGSCVQHDDGHAVVQ